MKRILVIGASGFIGGYLTEQFLSEGYTIWWKVWLRCANYSFSVISWFRDTLKVVAIHIRA